MRGRGVVCEQPALDWLRKGGIPGGRRCAPRDAVRGPIQ